MLKITQIKETRKTRDWHADWATFEPYTVLCVIYLSSYYISNCSITDHGLC